MRVLVIGAGGVGAAMTSIAARRSFFEELVIADIDGVRAARAADATGDPRVRAAALDASSKADVLALLRHIGADVVVNACDPRFNPPIFDAAFESGAHYVDMAMHMSVPHPTRPYEECGVKLGDDQFAVASEWEERGLLALVGMGVEPGLSDVFARYAADHLFSRIDEIGVRDGGSLEVEGRGWAPTFSIWTTIEECLNPPIVYERDRGWFTTEPFSEPEVFDFPDGIGPQECVNVEHEEVLLMPRWLEVGRVTFKYGLGEEFIDVLRTLHKLQLDSVSPVRVRGVEVSPRDVVAACLPNPAELGHLMSGLTCAGSYVQGVGNDGRPRASYLYHVVDNGWSMAEFGHQAVVWQTAVNPVVALELLADGAWSGAGVLGPEAFDADPYLELLGEHGPRWAIDERVVDEPADEPSVGDRAA
jgi:saccharopine dehydrogenase-like NADP-dependent oxidoreductase